MAGDGLFTTGAGRMSLQRLVAGLRADIGFLLSRLLYGWWACALLSFGLAVGVTAAVAAGFLVVFVVPWVLGAVVLACFVALFLRGFSERIRGWVDGRPFRRGVTVATLASARGAASVIAWWLLACRATARGERARIASHRDVDIPIAYRPLPSERPRTLQVLVADPATWRDLAYLTLAPVYVTLAWVLVVATLLLAATAIVHAPSTELAGPGVTDAAAWLAVPAGVGLLAVAPFVTHLLASGATALASTLLSTGESARMRAELDEQRLRRQLAVDAAERERRRIERDLHDGAQQRLVALGISLGLAREALPDDPVAGAALVTEAHTEAKLALAELRDLARGIHPAILGDRGLDAALSDLVRRSHIPISVVVVAPRRAPASVESAAYFVVAEALTNLARHSGASRATVEIRQDDQLLVVEVSDDGGGGADPERGTGLDGLADRVGALGGTLSIDSPVGGPTTIRAEIPCGW